MQGEEPQSMPRTDGASGEAYSQDLGRSPQRTILELNSLLLQSIANPAGHLPVVISLLEPFSIIAKSHQRFHY